MSGSENLKPVRTTAEARERGRNGGRASGAARRRKAQMRKTMEWLLTMRAEVPGLTEVLLADGGESTYEEIISMAMIEKAMRGDVAAYNAIKATVGQTDKTEEDLEEQKIRTDRAKRARDQEVGNADSGEENIQSFLRAMNPTKEDLESLFEEEEDDDEKTEKTGEV